MSNCKTVKWQTAAKVAAFAFVVLSMNLKFLNEEIQYFIFILSMFTMFFVYVIIDMVNYWDDYVVRTLTGAKIMFIVWGIKKMLLGDPYKAGLIEYGFGLSVIIATIYLIWHYYKRKELA